MQIVIQTPTPNILESLNFYKSLGFILTTIGENHFFSTKNLTIQVNSDRFARAGIKLFTADINSYVNNRNLAHLSSKTTRGILITSPSGCPIYVEEKANNPVHEKEQTISGLGHFSGLSLETNNIARSIEFWGLFDFTKNGGNVDHGWVSLIHEATGFTISLMKYNCCPHLFFNPSLSFFNGAKNLEVIATINELNIPITEEITYFNSDSIVDNIIVRDPGGLGFFVFND